MNLALSTRWNAGRHNCGQAMLAEIREAGFRDVELGYDLGRQLVPGVVKSVREQLVRVVSLHNYCPVPTAATRGHPEIYSPASLDPRERSAAVKHTSETLRFAAEVGAPAIVVHGGRVRMKRLTARLVNMRRNGREYSLRYEKTLDRLRAVRNRRAGRFIDALSRSLEELMPVAEDCNARVAIENLPSADAIPTASEIETLCRRFDARLVGFWLDTGHARIAALLGFDNPLSALPRLRTVLAGMHVHDVAASSADHLPPGKGEIDFHALKSYAAMDIPAVLELRPGTPAGEIEKGRLVLEKAWN